MHAMQTVHRRIGLRTRQNQGVTFLPTLTTPAHPTVSSARVVEVMATYGRRREDEENARSDAIDATKQRTTHHDTLH